MSFWDDHDINKLFDAMSSWNDYDINKLLDIKKSIYEEKINLETDILHFKITNNDYDLKRAKDQLKYIDKEIKLIEGHISEHMYKKVSDYNETTGNNIVKNIDEFSCTECFIIFKISFMSDKKNVCNECDTG